MKTERRETVFTLQGGATLVLAGGAQWQILNHYPRVEAGDAENELTRLREQSEHLRSIVNGMRELRGKDPIA